MVGLVGKRMLGEIQICLKCLCNRPYSCLGWFCNRPEGCRLIFNKSHTYKVNKLLTLLLANLGDCYQFKGSKVECSIEEVTNWITWDPRGSSCWWSFKQALNHSVVFCYSCEGPHLANKCQFIKGKCHLCSTTQWNKWSFVSVSNQFKSISLEIAVGWKSP